MHFFTLITFICSSITAEALFVSYIFSSIPIFVRHLPGMYTFTCIYVIINDLNSVFILEWAALSICYEPFWAAHVMHASPMIKKVHERVQSTGQVMKIHCTYIVGPFARFIISSASVGKVFLGQSRCKSTHITWLSTKP